MLENEKKVTELNEEELEDVSGGYATLGPSGRPGVSIRTYTCPECGTRCQVRVGPATTPRCSSCGAELQERSDSFPKKNLRKMWLLA